MDPDTGDVYAFGHPLFNLGPIEYPMKSSTVHLVLPSLMNSFKMASSGETIGTWVQDAPQPFAAFWISGPAWFR